MKTRRFEIIDIAKAILVYFVALAHMQIMPYNATLAFSMNCLLQAFFFLSGLFFEPSCKRKTGREFLLAKVRTLILPYLIWSTVALMYHAIQFIVTGAQTGEWGGSLLAFLAEASDIYLYARSLWFLLVLFLMNVICSYIERLVGWNRAAFLGLMTVGWAISFAFGKVTVLSLYRLQWFLPYFLLGIVCSYLEVEKRLDRIATRSLMQQVLVTVLTLVLYIFWARSLMNEEFAYEFYYNHELIGSHWPSYLSAYLISVLAILLLFEISGLLLHAKRLRPVLSRAGAITIDIYIIHMFPVVVIRQMIVSLPLPPALKGQLALAVYTLFIVAGIVLLVDQVLRRSSLYRFSVGGRV